MMVVELTGLNCSAVRGVIDLFDASWLVCHSAGLQGA